MRDRALQICSITLKEPELRRLKEVFQANGFPEDLVRKTLASHSAPVPHAEPRQQPTETLCTPYVRGLSVTEKLERVPDQWALACSSEWLVLAVIAVILLDG